jgi:3-oxoacyl-[acyl-carrier protein] reductase
MSDSPQKKIALVTGASGGIGKAIALRLGREGYFLLLHYNSNEAKASEVLGQLEASGYEGKLVRFDLAGSDKDIEKALSVALEGLGAYDLAVLVNNAGIHKDTLTPLMSTEMFDSVVKTNLYGCFYLMRWASKIMMRQRHGVIVNVSSLAGQTGNAGQINYAAAKAGLIAMTKTLAVELGSRNVRVNAVAPGLIETEMIETIPQLEEFKKRIPLRRFGKPEEVAGVVAFLASEDATYISGHTISVNGGLFPS